MCNTEGWENLSFLGWWNPLTSQWIMSKYNSVKWRNTECLIFWKSFYPGQSLYLTFFIMHHSAATKKKVIYKIWNEGQRHRGRFKKNGKSSVWICACLSFCDISWPAVDPLRKIYILYKCQLQLHCHKFRFRVWSRVLEQTYDATSTLTFLLDYVLH